MSVPDRIREAVQAVLDEDGDGWTVPYLVVAMGIERMREDGSIEAVSWYYAPAEQAEWMTVGLLEAAMELRAAAETCD